MTKARKAARQHAERRGLNRWITGLLGSILAVVVTSLALGGWKAHTFVTEELASKDEVIVAGTQAQTALDIQMRHLIAQISRLEEKRNKNADEREQLKYLRGELERLRKIRSLR